MIADLHVHSTHSSDGEIDPARIPALARARGLDAVAVVDHGTVAGGLAARAARVDGDPLVIVGAEVRTAEGEIVGLFLSEDVPPGLSPEETVARIHEQGGLAFVPHPFDRFRRSPLTAAALERIAGRIDAVEAFNARNLLRADDRSAAEWARDHDVPVVAGSDAHTPGEVGSARTVLDAFHDAATLRAALAGAMAEGRGSGPLVHVRTALVKRARKRRTGREPGR